MDANIRHVIDGNEKRRRLALHTVTTPLVDWNWTSKN